MRTSWLLLMRILLTAAATIKVPNSPCPGVFQYQQDSKGVWSGHIRVPATSGLPMKINAELSLPAALPSVSSSNKMKFSGRLTLLNGKEAVLRQMRMGTLQFVDYKLIFPLSYPLPNIKNITANEKIICEGPAAHGNVLTTIRLEHSLFPMITPLAGSDQLPGERPTDKPVQADTSQQSFSDNGRLPASSGDSVPPASNENNDGNSYINPNNPFFQFGKPTQVQTTITKNYTSTTQSINLPPRDHQGFASSVSEICGQPIVPNELVLNGRRTERGEWPWIAAIFTITSIGQDFSCSGNLVNKWTVVTAGHCIKYRDNPSLTPQDLVVYLGKYQVRRFAEPYSQVREVAEIYLHPDYNSNNFDADLAILIFKEAVEYSRYVLPVCVWTKPESLNYVIGRVGVVVGWGRDEQGNKVTDTPRKVNVPVVSREDCINSRKDFALITSDRTFCGGFRNDSGPCSGDSGGGLFLSYTSEGSKRWFLRGIVSLSLLDPETQSCDLHQYIVFTDVAKFHTWITGIIQKTERRIIST